MLAKLFTAEQRPGVRWEDLREPTGSTVERAVIGGARADRLGYAFAIGYSTALEALAGDGNAALCATEEAGNHPRAIQTRLVDGRVTGSKRWATMADRMPHLLIVAREGDDEAGRPRLKLVRVRTDAPGVTLTPSGATFVPEISHARLTLDNVAGEVLPGDGYADYVKPFRTIEDIHVHAAIVGYLAATARRRGAGHTIAERLASVATSLVGLGREDAKAPSTHIALAGALSTSHAAIGELEVAWAAAAAAAPDDEWTRWQRDRPLLQVAGKARSERLARAWQAITTPGAGAAS